MGTASNTLLSYSSLTPPPLTNGLPVIPALVVHPLPQQLDGRLCPIHLHGRHVEVVNEEDKVLAQRRTKHTLASVGQVERKEKGGQGRRKEGEGGRREVESRERGEMSGDKVQ